MAQKVNISESDSKLGYLCQNPGWFKYKAISMKDKASQQGDTHNYFVDMRGLSGEMTDVEFTKLFNTSKGFKKDLVNWMKACNGGKQLPTGDYDPESCLSIEFEAYTERGKDGNGNPINDLKDFRPISG